MKLNRNYVFIAISSLALITVLIIQVNWILETARIKEELFNEKVNIVLSRVTEAISSDKETCRKIGEKEPSSATIVLNAHAKTEICINNAEIFIIDSLINHFTQLYNFHLDYSFVLVKPVPFLVNNASGFKNNVYNQRLEDVVSKNGMELVMIVPEKKQFIMAEMGVLFITSVVLILVVLVMFWRTVLSLLKEKQISEHTTEFLNNMTHEFKTPLTNIALAGKMILKHPLIAQEKKVKHYSEIILEENDKLSKQVEQVLNMSALERGDIPLQKSKLDVHQLIHEALKCISVQLENKQGNLKLDLVATNFNVLGDKTHLTNALYNLIDNAIKYAKQQPELVIETYNQGVNLILVVADKGLGIDRQYQKKVFDKYFRVGTGNVHEVKGFGLGLAYVKQIVDCHGGKISLQSDVGKGASFKISFAYA